MVVPKERHVVEDIKSEDVCQGGKKCSSKQKQHQVN